MQEPDIINLHLKFKLLKTYREKVEFFDQQFGCFPHQYPEFDPGLKMLFDQEQFSSITELFEKERRKAVILDRRFEIGGHLYIFNATAVNSNTAILNDYILYSFINNDKRFEDELMKINDAAETKQEEIWEAWMNALNKVDSIASVLAGGAERGLRYRFMNVFINGYRDKEKGVLKQFFSRKKFIELYLYAQGVLFRQYFEQLNNLCDFSRSLVHRSPLQKESSEVRILREFIKRHFIQ